MHASAMAFVEEQLTQYVRSNISTVRNTLGEVRAWAGNTLLVEFGAQDVNGTIRDLPILQVPTGLDYIGVDLAPGKGVDLVMDARYITPDDLGDRQAHIVVCTNVFEHDERWDELVAAAYRILVPGGWFIVQCAGPGFQVHSGRSESLELEPDEWYRNVPHDVLREVLRREGFVSYRTWYREQWPHDTTGFAQK